MSRCPYGIGFDRKGQAVALFCGKWSCERCRKSLARKWSWRARLHIQTTESDAYAWHFTLPSYVKTAYQGFLLLPDVWDRLRRIVRKVGPGWQYLAFVECHPKRARIPHFHCISMLECPRLGTHVRDPIKDLAVLSGFGYIALEEPVTSFKAAGYVAKYASKHDPAMPRNFRRVRASQGWTKLPERELHAYLVKARSESVSEFVLRVADETATLADTIYSRYRTAVNLWEINSYGDDL